MSEVAGFNLRKNRKKDMYEHFKIGFETAKAKAANEKRIKEENDLKIRQRAEETIKVIRHIHEDLRSFVSRDPNIDMEMKPDSLSIKNRTKSVNNGLNIEAKDGSILLFDEIGHQVATADIKNKDQIEKLMDRLGIEYFKLSSN